jgi:monoterpene epsilon-lactone hydrolase
MVIDRFRPDALQRARLDVIDKPLRALPALPGSEVASDALPLCPAEKVLARRARSSGRVVVYFHGSALATLGLNSHRFR